MEKQPKFPRRLFTKDEEPQPGKSIAYYSNSRKLFPALEAVLEADIWEELLESRLGVFLKFYKLNFGWASRVVQFILGFQLDCKKKYEIWSLINATPLRFSLNEFEQLTGLNCEDVEELEEAEVTPEMKYFWEKLGVSIDVGPTVDELTEACKRAGKWTRDEKLMLGYLSIFAGFIEARKMDSPTRLNYARLVMDVEAFANYPWGRVAFKTLIESVKRADLTKTVTLYGFAEVLQVWAYYAMPDFGRHYGNPLPDNPTPPVLAFNGCRGRKYIKEAMLKQVSFNNFCVKEQEEMFPTWDDEVDDVLIENVVGAMFGEFGGGRWKWKPSHWRSKGVKKLEATKGQKRKVKDDESRVDPDDGSMKKTCPVPHAAIEEEGLKSLAEAMKQHFSECCRTLSGEIKAGFEAFDKKFDLLSEKVVAVEHTVAKMKEPKDEEYVKSNDGRVSTDPSLKSTKKTSKTAKPAIPLLSPVLRLTRARARSSKKN